MSDWNDVKIGDEVIVRADYSNGDQTRFLFTVVSTNFDPNDERNHYIYGQHTPFIYVNDTDGFAYTLELHQPLPKEPTEFGTVIEVKDLDGEKFLARIGDADDFGPWFGAVANYSWDDIKGHKVRVVK